MEQQGVMGERLVQMRRRVGLSQIELARKLGVVVSTIWRWENNRGNLPARSLPRIAEVLNTSVAYLLGETNDTSPSDETEAPLVPPKPSVPSVSLPLFPLKEMGSEREILRPELRIKEAIPVPVVSPVVKVCCGEGNSYPEEVRWQEKGTILIPLEDLYGYAWQAGDGGFKILTVEGDSMEPQINDKDRILFVDMEVKNGDIAVILYQGRLILRGVLFEKEVIRLKAVNPNYEDIVVPRDEADETLRFFGRMLGIVPRFKKKTTFF